MSKCGQITYFFKPKSAKKIQETRPDFEGSDVTDVFDSDSARQ